MAELLFSSYKCPECGQTDTHQTIPVLYKRLKTEKRLKEEHVCRRKNNKISRPNRPDVGEMSPSLPMAPDEKVWSPYK